MNAEHGTGRVRVGSWLLLVALVAGCGELDPGADIERKSSAVVIDDSNLSMTSPSQVATKRAALVSFIWGAPGFPPQSQQATLASTFVNYAVTWPPGAPFFYHQLTTTNLSRIDRLLVSMEKGMKNEFFHFIPAVPNGRLVVVHGGHGAAVADGLAEVINALVDEGYGVLAGTMLCYYTPSLTCPVGSGDSGPHNVIFATPSLAPATGSVVKYFVEPIAMGLNYLRTHAASDSFPVYTEFDMVGLSGGGWTTMLYAAIDPSIKISAICSGGKPMYLRRCEVNDWSCLQTNGDGIGYDGDREQMYNPLYQVAGYLDLYALGAAGAGRRQMQVQIRHDNCCFAEAQYANGPSGPPPDYLPPSAPRPAGIIPGVSWAQAVRNYEAKLKTFFTASADLGWYRFEIDETENSHQVSPSARVATILAELDGDRSPFGAASTNDIYTKGLTGTLFHLPPSWSNLGFALVGAPSVIESGSTTHVMLRDDQGGLRHELSTNGGMTWTSESFPGVIAGDPVATLVGMRLDVFAVGTDKRLYHWQKTGSGSPALEQVNASTEVVGSLAVVAPGPTRLDVIGRDSTGTMFHFRTDGSGWLTPETMPGTFRGFPAAVAAGDGWLRTYARGTDDFLWEDAQQIAGGGWLHSRLADFASGGSGVKMAGSPSASINPTSGKPFVLTRGPTGNVERFEIVTGWVRTNEGVPSGGGHSSPSVTFAPVAVRGGLFTRGVEGNVWFKALPGSTWTWEAGQILLSPGFTRAAPGVAFNPARDYPLGTAGLIPTGKDFFSVGAEPRARAVDRRARRSFT